MTRPSDESVACAFVLKALCYQEMARLGASVPSALEFIDEVTRDAEKFDAEAGGTDRQTEEVMQIEAVQHGHTHDPVASAADGKAAAPYINETAETFTSRGANVKETTDTERGYCPLCTGNVWKGRYCNGPKCPLRPA